MFQFFAMMKTPSYVNPTSRIPLSDLNPNVASKEASPRLVLPTTTLHSPLSSLLLFSQSFFRVLLKQQYETMLH